MPVVLDLGWGRIKARIYFKDHNPPHVHVTAPAAIAIFKITTLELTKVKGFTESAVGRIQRVLEERQDLLMEMWDEYQKG
jgi:hypothetical protein